MTELNYADFKNDMERKLKKAKEIVLATCADDRVTARTVCPLNDGLDIFFSTGGNSLKVRQIKNNPQVALILNGVNIEAAAECYGHPGTHPDFLKKYHRKYPMLSKLYKSEPEDVLVIAKPTLISIYRYTGGKACKDILDAVKQQAYRVVL